jgi:hypothetical protein
MSVEELLKPRFKVIADYPGCEYSIGYILSIPDADFDTGYEDFLKTYPHLFKELEWHDERDEIEMPKYIKGNHITNKGIIFKLLDKSQNGRIFHDDTEIELCHLLRYGSFYTPATEDEYIKQNSAK